MKKKILIAGFFAILMMLMPFTSVAGTDEITSVKNEQKEDENIGVLAANELMLSVQQMSLVNPNIIIEELIIQLQNFISWVLQNYGDNPEIVNLCQQISNIINSPLWKDTPFCNTMQLIAMLLLVFMDIFEPGSLGQIMAMTMFLSFTFVYGLLCYDETSIYNEGAIGTFDMTVFTSIIGESYEVNTCPCGE